MVAVSSKSPMEQFSQSAPLFESQITSLKKLHQGKVRDIYAVDADHLLIVTTDRLSAFDVVLPDPIPYKGEVLTRISQFWFQKTRHIVGNHLSEVALADVITDAAERAPLLGRAMVVKKLNALPLEAVVRGYLIGSGYKDYQQSGSVCGIALPPGLQMAERLANPLFTPAYKAPAGQHDENIDFAAMVKLVGGDHAAEIRRIALQLYAFAAEHANLLGVEPKQVAAIDTALLVDVVSQALGAANPKLAAQITAAAPKSIALPDVEIPFVASTRRFATAAVPRLALAAFALIGIAFLVGDRPQVLRRAGAWAFGAGLMWVIVPRGVIWASDKWAPGNAAVVRAVLHGATGVVTALATLLLLGGASLFAVGAVLGQLASNGRDTRDGRVGRDEQRLTPGWRSFTGREMPSSKPSAVSARFDQHA